MAHEHKPGDLFRAHQSGNAKKASGMMKAMKKSQKAATPSKMDLGMALKKKVASKKAPHNVSEGTKYTSHGQLTPARGTLEKKKKHSVKDHDADDMVMKRKAKSKKKASR